MPVKRHQAKRPPSRRPGMPIPGHAPVLPRLLQLRRRAAWQRSSSALARSAAGAQPAAGAGTQDEVPDEASGAQAGAPRLLLKQPLGSPAKAAQLGPPLRLIPVAEPLPLPPDLPHLRRKKRRHWIPPLLRLPLFHALLCVVFLACLPHHPLSIPTALGLACVVILYIQVLAYRAGFTLDHRPMGDQSMQDRWR